MTSEEFSDRYLGGYIIRPFVSSSPATNVEMSTTIPPRKDWREAGILSPVKRQTCGNCWAMAATEQLESYLALATQTNVTALSVQQITACSENPYECGGSGGCEGAIEQIGYEYANLFGVVSEADYPTINPKDNCTYNPKTQTPKHKTFRSLIPKFSKMVP